MGNTTNRVLHMTPDQWASLDQLAVETNSRETVGRGHDVRVPKWTRLIRRIADGDFTLIEREPYRLPAGLAEAAQMAEERQREQERIAQQQRRVEQHTVQKQAVRKVPVKMEQLSMLEVEPA
jgi:hypothetical protein